MALAGQELALHDGLRTKRQNVDAGKYYALLRFEEASLAMRASLRLRIVETIGDRQLTLDEFSELFGFTAQASRTFVPLLEVMEILQRSERCFGIASRAKRCLAEGSPASRRPYLAMGGGDDIGQFIDLLRGKLPDESVPLYGTDDTPHTLMDDADAAGEIAFGLSSRARNFAEPLAAAIKPYAGKARILADIGAGSPYVGLACLAAIPHLSKAILVDRANGMQFARQLAEQHESGASRIEFCEQDFFQAVPPADIYCISNTAHDWLPDEYATMVRNVRDAIAPGGIVCLHEPLLAADWNSAEQWVHALWMACYAMTLFRLTQGKGTCYTRAEHDEIMADNGFQPDGKPVTTCDGCTALFYRLAGDRLGEPSSAETATSPHPSTR